MSCQSLYIQVAQCTINLGISKPSTDSPWNNPAVTHLKVLWKSKKGCCWMKIPSYSKSHILHSIPAIPLRMHTIPHKQTQSSSAPARTEFGIQGSPSLWSWGYGPPAPGEKHKDPRVLQELTRNQCAKTQGKAWEPKAPAWQLHLPSARKGDSAINAHVGPALDPAGAGDLNPSLTQEAGQQTGNPRSNHTMLLLAAFTCGYNEWILWQTPKKVTWTRGYFGISHLVSLLGSETYYCTVIL